MPQEKDSEAIEEPYSPKSPEIDNPISDKNENLQNDIGRNVATDLSGALGENLQNEKPDKLKR